MSASLGDFFSEDIKKKLAAEIEISLKGIVLIEITEFTQAKGKKFAVLIAESICKGFVGMVPINTNKTISGNYVTITANDFSFLDYDSHICCDVICEKAVGELRTFIVNNPGCIKGEITDHQHILILQLLSESRGITNASKKKYGLIE